MKEVGASLQHKRQTEALEAGSHAEYRLVVYEGEDLTEVIQAWTARYGVDGISIQDTSTYFTHNLPGQMTSTPLPSPPPPS